MENGSIWLGSSGIGNIGRGVEVNNSLKENDKFLLLLLLLFKPGVDPRDEGDKGILSLRIITMGSNGIVLTWG